VLCQLFPARLAEYLFLPVQFIERIGFEHNAFLVTAMGEAKKMPDFMGPFFCYPVNEVVIISISAVILIAEAGSRDHCGTDGLAGKPE
jgi:uncharacterized membrane protein YwaF